MPLQRMTAEVILRSWRDVDRVTAALIELDFEVHYLDDWTDDSGGYAWLLASKLTELDQEAFLDYAKTVIEPLGADVFEAGISKSTEEWVAGKEPLDPERPVAVGKRPPRPS